MNHLIQYLCTEEIWTREGRGKAMPNASSQYTCIKGVHSNITSVTWQKLPSNHINRQKLGTKWSSNIV